LTLLLAGAGAGYWHYQSLEAAPVKKEPSKPKLVANIGGKKIMLKDFNREYQRYLAVLDIKEPRGELEAFRIKKTVLNRMIEELFLEAAADKRGVEVSNEELEEEIDRLIGNDGGRGREARVFGAKNVTQDEWKEEVRLTMRIRKMILEEVDSKITVDETEVKAFFDKNQENFQWPERVRALQIMTKDEFAARRISRDLEEDALWVKMNPKKNKPKLDFSQISREKSISPDAARGGDLGFFSRGQMPMEFEEVVFNLKEGEVSEVVESIHGYHIFKLVKREAPRQMKFEESKEKITQILRESKREKEFSRWIEDLKEETGITVHQAPVL